jgi:hypothetical protein
MSTKEKMLRRLREIASVLDSDLGWIDPQRRQVFVAQQKRERDETLELVMQEAPEPADRPAAERVIEHLRRDPADAAEADALEAWIAQA